MLAVLLGLVLTVCGGALTLTVGGRLEYILPAPAATQEGGELNALYEEAQKQMASIADSITAGAVGARAQGVNLSAEAQSAEATVYAVGSGYFDVTHETLLDGRLISEADVKRAENVVVIDERMALSFFAGNEPVGQTVTLSGLEYEVAGVIKAERRLGETNEHIAYIPITSASANALAMQTVEMIAKTADKTTGSAILMENTLKTWQPGGSFYNYDKLALGAVMPIRWAVLFVGVALLLSLLARLNAAAWGRVCLYADRLKTRYARDMLAGMIASALLMLLGYAALAGAAFYGPAPCARALSEIGREAVRVIRPGEKFAVGCIEIEAIPADHGWQSMDVKKYGAPFGPEDCVGYILRTPHAKLLFPGDTRRMPQHRALPDDFDAMAFDVSADPWHMGVRDGAELARHLSCAKLLPCHFGTYDAPEAVPHNGSLSAARKALGDAAARLASDAIGAAVIFGAE